MAVEPSLPTSTPQKPRDLSNFPIVLDYNQSNLRFKSMNRRPEPSTSSSKARHARELSGSAAISAMAPAGGLQQRSQATPVNYAAQNKQRIKMMEHLIKTKNEQIAELSSAEPFKMSRFSDVPSRVRRFSHQPIILPPLVTFVPFLWTSKFHKILCCSVVCSSLSNDVGI